MQADPAPFKRGDVVTLKSGGLKMTVYECWFCDSCSEAERGWECSVMYADYGDIHEKEIPADMLEVYVEAIPF